MYIGMITADTVKAARSRLKENQTDFAARFGVNQSTVSRWEEIGISGHPLFVKSIEEIMSSLPTGIQA